MKRHSVHIASLSHQEQQQQATAAAHPHRHSVHINPKLQAALHLPDGSTAKIVINPKFQQQQQQLQQLQQQQQLPSSGTVHINPNFRASPPAREEIPPVLMPHG
jgi:hypothetical protein